MLPSSTFVGALFAGRKQECDQLRSLLSELIREERASPFAMGAIVLGSSGSGKSRLVAHVLAEFAKTEITFLFAQSLPQHREIAYGTLLALVTPLFPSEGSHQERVDAALEKWGPRFLKFREALLALFAVRRPDNPEGAGVSGSHDLTGLYALFLLEFSEEAPLVLSVDDLEFIDPGSLEVLSRVTSSSASYNRLLLFITSTDAHEHLKLFEADTFRLIRLGPLTAEQIRDFLFELAGRREVPETFVRHIDRITSGAPHFLTEYLEDLFERKVITSEAGHWIFPRETETLPRPRTVEEIVVHRVQRLPPQTRSLLETAAAIGPRFPENLLRDVVNLPEEEFRSDLQQLAARRFLRTNAVAETCFLHESVHHGVLSLLTPEARVQTSVAVIAAWEAHRFDAADLRYLLREHLRGAGLPEPLLRHLIREAEISLDRQRLSDAEELAREAARVPWPDSLSPTWRARLYVVLSRIDIEKGNLEEAEAYVGSAIRLAEEADDPRYIAEAHYFLARVMEAQGLIDLADAALGIALRIAQECNDAATTFLALISHGRHRLQAGNLSAAETFFSRALELAREHEDLLDIDLALSHLARATEHLHNLDRARTLFTEVADRSLKQGKDLSHRIALQALARIAVAEGRADEAEAMLNRAERSAREKGTDRDREIALVFQSRFLIREKRYTEADEKLQEALEISRRIRTARGQAIVFGLLGRVNEGLGRMAEAEKAYRECLQWNKRLHGRAGERARSISLNYLAEFAERQGDFVQAKELLRQSLILAESAGDKRGIAMIKAWLERLKNR